MQKSRITITLIRDFLYTIKNLYFYTSTIIWFLIKSSKVSRLLIK